MNRYKFCSLNEYNTLLERFNLKAEECRGESAGCKYAGILYGALADSSQRVGKPIKASRISRKVGYRTLETRYARTKQWIVKHPQKLDIIRRTIRRTLRNVLTPDTIAAELRKAEITVMFHRRKEADGRIYGVTFIDHRTGLGVNGSRLGKEFSANRFQMFFTEAPLQLQQKQITAGQVASTQPPATSQTTHLAAASQVMEADPAYSTEPGMWDRLHNLNPLGELLNQAAQPDKWEELQQTEQPGKRRRKRSTK